MDLNSIVEDLKEGSSFCLSKEVDMCGDCSYEEYIFYISNVNCFYKQIIDWSLFPTKSFLKSITFEKLEEETALRLISLRLKQESLEKLESKVDQESDDK